MGFTSFTVDLAIGRNADPKSRKNRTRIGILEGWVSIFGNLILFLIKLSLGLITGSMALIADAFHTLSDVVTSAVVIVGFKISSKPADVEHPFGHGRAETIATLTIALMIGIVGFEFLKTGITRLIHPSPVSSSWIVISAVVLTILIKEGMSRYSYKLGDLIDSDTLRGDAVHHRSDMLSSILVAIALIGVKYNLLFLDGLMAIGVAGFMLYAAFDVSRNAIDDLLGKPVSKETVKKIFDLARTVEGAVNAHDIIVHNYGNRQYISLHVEVSDQVTPEKMHQIADQVERTITLKMDAEVVTHVDPITIAGENINRIKSILKKISEQQKEDFRIQDLRIVGKTTVEAILFEVPHVVGYAPAESIRNAYLTGLSKEFPDSDIVIELKPQVSSI